MARSVKIHKKKSFMFTTKHHSFAGWMGMIIGVCTLGISVSMLVYSYHNAGDVETKFGAIGMISAILNLLGMISGVLGLKERDAFKTVPIIAISANSVMLLAWIVTIIIS